MDKYLKIIKRMSQHLRNVDCAIVNAPVGFSLSSDGERIYVKYSLTSPTGHDSLSDAIESVKEFLDVSENINSVNEVDQKHKVFPAIGIDLSYQQITKIIRPELFEDETVMRISGHDSDCTYITKEQAMTFFGLIEPE